MLQVDQAGLARMIGVSRLWVNQVEKGKPGASMGLVLRALDALGARLMADTADATTGERLSPVVTADINAIVAEARNRDRS